MQIAFQPSAFHNSKTQVAIFDDKIKLRSHWSFKHTIIVHSDPFPREKHLYFLVRMLQNEQHTQNFYVGVAADQHREKCFWFDSGDQISLNDPHRLYRSQNFEIVGQNPTDIAKGEAQFTVEVCVKKHIFAIYNKSRAISLTSKHDFEQQYSLWRLFFGVHQQNLKLQILRVVED